MRGAVTAVTAPAAAVSADAEAARQLRAQYAAVVAAENNAFVQRVRLGGMLLQWEAFLGPCRGGRGGAGDGLKGWLAANLPELGYAAAHSYKEQARKVIAMLGGGEPAAAALMGEDAVKTPDGETVDVDARILRRRDELFEKVDSRRKLEQSYFAFMAGELRGRPGRRPGFGDGDEGLPEAGGALKELAERSVLDGLFGDLTLLMARMRRKSRVLMRHAGALAARHPDECADFARLAKDYAAAFGGM